MKIKKCNRCQIEKNIEEFYKQKSLKDGHKNYCIECSKIENNE